MPKDGLIGFVAAIVFIYKTLTAIFWSLLHPDYETC
jgi:hypothetical protein